MTKSVLALIGDYYHPASNIEPALRTAFSNLESLGYQLTLIETDALLSQLNARPAAVILYKENRVNPEVQNPDNWMTAEIEKAIAGYVRSGGAWLAWHAGMASFPSPGDYTDMLRGSFEWHPKDHANVTYTPRALGENDLNQHPIISGIEPFDFPDEHYFVSVKTDETQVFLRSKSIDGESYGGWCHQFGNGRVCCVTPAHLAAALHHPQMQKLLVRSLKWCVGELADQESPVNRSHT